MSRSLGAKARHKKAQSLHQTNDPNSNGRRAFDAGLPQSANPYIDPSSGKGRAWAKGWHAARMLSQKGQQP